MSDPREPHGVSGLFRHEPGEPCVVCDRPVPDPVTPLSDDDDLMQRLATATDHERDIPDLAGRAYIRIRSLQQALAALAHPSDAAGEGWFDSHDIVEMEAARATRDETALDVAVREARAAYPEQRLGQIIVNATHRTDPFYVTDDEMARALREYARLSEPTDA